MTTQLSDKEISLFSKLFNGYEDAYGEYRVDKVDSIGKQTGKAMTHMCPASLNDYKQHLLGSRGIGIIPLLKNDTCWFGAIDIDIKGDVKLNESHAELEAKVRKYKLPLMLFRSKSDGAHLYLFAKSPISAKVVQSKLAEFAGILGYGGCEVFPKQTTRIKKDGTDFGNWINIPLFGETRTGLFEGKELDLKQSLATCEYLATTEDELKNFSIVQNEEFNDAPPCIQQMATVGVGDGGRNNSLFNFGIYFKKKFEDDWQEKLKEYNEEKVEPPLENGEIKELIKQIGRKEYFYTCATAPLCNFCDKKKCIKRKYGIGGESKESDEGSFVLPITGLTKYIAGNNESFRWGVSTNEAMLEFSTDELLSLDVHRRKFAELMNILIPSMKNKEFFTQMSYWMERCEIVYDPEDASESGEMKANIESWFTDKGGAKSCDEMMKRIWWKEDDTGNIYFILSHLVDYLVHQKKMRNISLHKISRFVQTKFGAEQTKLTVKKKRRNAYVIKGYEFEDETPYDIPDVTRKEEEI